jgi:lipopolysaccharide biosynthesis regulator YciM
VALNILDFDKKNLWALEKIWVIYRDLKKWAKATEYLEKLLHQRRETNKRLLAIYKAQEGLELFESGDCHNARLIFRKAIKIDPTCEAPYYYYAESYVRDQREADAVDWWVRFSEVAPDKAWLVFNSLQKILFNLGNFSRIEDFYLGILKHKPGDVRTITALANFYERKGDLDKAADLVDELVDANPTSIIAKIAYCKLMVALKREREINDILNEILYKFDVVDKVTCTHCGHIANEVLWICPVCGTADSFLIKS